MTDVPDPRDEHDDQDPEDQPDQPERARRSGGKAGRKAAGKAGGASGKAGRKRSGSGPGAGASRGGDPGRSGRTSGGGRRRSAPAPRPADPAAGDPDKPAGPAGPTASAATGGPDGTGARRAGATGSGARTARIRRDKGAGASAGADDPAEMYLAAYLDAVERGDEPPDLDELDPGARADVEAVLALLAGVDTGIDPGAGHDVAAADPAGRIAVGQGKSRRNALAARALVAQAAGTNPGPHDGDSEGEPELRPLGESEFAVEHGLSRTNPDVVVSGPAVRQARAATGMTTVDVAEEMARRGYAIAAEAVEALEQSTAHRMHPRDARLLAAVLDLPLDRIEASAAPWSADPEALAELAGATTGATASPGNRAATSASAAGDTAGEPDPGSGAVSPIVLGDDVVLRTGTGSHLGVLRCAGGADVLDSRTYRQAAASRLVGPWSHLAGALLVADEAPHLALAVDALDCVARQHAPSGLIGFSRLAEPETIAAALASYDRAYAIDWSDPDPLEGLATRPDQAAEALAGRIEGLAERLADEARRSRQIGKRPGYTAAARWLRETPTTAMVALLDELAHADPDDARRRIDELTEVVLA